MPQPDATAPKVVGTAHCSSVRPVIASSRCARASRAHAPAASSTAATMTPTRLLRDEHERGVDDVLTCRAVMHGAGCLGTGAHLDASADLGDERDHRIPVVRRASGKLRTVETAHLVARRADLERGRQRRDAGPRARTREGGLGAAQRVDDSRVIGRRNDRGRAEDPVEKLARHSSSVSDREEGCLALTLKVDVEPKGAALGCRDQQCPFVL